MSRCPSPSPPIYPDNPVSEQPAESAPYAGKPAPNDGSRSPDPVDGPQELVSSSYSARETVGGPDGPNFPPDTSRSVLERPQDESEESPPTGGQGQPTTLPEQETAQEATPTPPGLVDPNREPRTDAAGTYSPWEDLD